MRLLSLILSILIICGTTPAWAQTSPESSSTQKYKSIYDKCIDRNQSDDVVEFNNTISLCSEKATNTAKSDLNAVYKKLYDALIADDRAYDAEQLEKAQTFWVGYRNANCDFSNYFYGKQGVQRCYLDTTSERAVEVDSYLAELP